MHTSIDTGRFTVVPGDETLAATVAALEARGFGTEVYRYVLQRRQRGEIGRRRQLAMRESAAGVGWPEHSSTGARAH